MHSGEDNTSTIPLTQYPLHDRFFIVIAELLMLWNNLHRVPEKKQANLIFDITSPSVEIFFAIFEAPCLGLIVG